MKAIALDRKLLCKIEQLVHKMPAVYDLLERGYVLAGGFVRDALLNVPYRDIDMYRIATSVSVPERTLTLPKTVHVINWVARHAPRQLIEGFDFTLCQAAVYIVDGALCGSCAADFYFDTEARRLVYTSPQLDTDPGKSLMRAFKFVARGYTIDAKNVARLLLHIDTVRRRKRAAFDTMLTSGVIDKGARY
jgi:hypothetical protein